MAKAAITVIPTAHEDVLAMLYSDALRTVEQAIASEVGTRIVEDYSTTCTTYTQAEMSVSGMTVTETESLLRSHRDQIIKFGIAFLRDKAATDDSQEYPDGEEQDPPGPGKYLGLGVGFGIKYAIFYNFLMNRTPEDLLVYLKNRRIPHHTRFAKDLRRVFDAAQQTRD
jgi:hypothetical protein